MAKEATLPTQEIIEIDQIKNGALVLRNGALRKILLVTGVNFELKSEEEQNMIIFSFQNFLNALDFSLQIFIHTRRVNIEEYLEKLKQREAGEDNDLLKNMIVEYHNFIKALTADNPIMEKGFFVVVPYQGINIKQLGKGVKRGFSNVLDKMWVIKKTDTEKESTPEPLVSHIPETSFVQIDQRTEQVISRLSQIGLRAVPLNDTELAEFLYNLYNPEAVEKKTEGII